MTALPTRLSTQTWGLFGDITCKAVNYISGRFARNSFRGNILLQWPGAESNCRHADFQSEHLGCEQLHELTWPYFKFHGECELRKIALALVRVSSADVAAVSGDFGALLLHAELMLQRDYIIGADLLSADVSQLCQFRSRKSRVQ